MEPFNDLSVPLKFGVAFIVLLAVLGVGGYLMRRLSAGNLVALGRRQARLAVIESASVDGRRRLVLVRRDKVEHLLLIGGPTDVVIEPTIDRVAAAATATAPARDTKAAPATVPPPARETRGLLYAEPPHRPVREATTRERREAIAPEPMSREARAREPMPPEHQRLESLIEDAGAPPLLPTPPDPDPAFNPPPVPPSFEPVFQIPPAPEPKRMPAAPPLPSRAAQSEESGPDLANLAQRPPAESLQRLRPLGGAYAALAENQQRKSLKQ